MVGRKCPFPEWRLPCLKKCDLLVHDPPEVHEVARVARFPVDGAVLHNVVNVVVECRILH